MVSFYLGLPFLKSFNYALLRMKAETLSQNRFGTCWSLDFLFVLKGIFLAAAKHGGRSKGHTMIQRFYWILGLKARISSSSSKLSSKQRLPRYIVVVSLQRFIFLFLKAKTFMLCSCHFWKSLCKLRPFYRNSFRLLIDTVGQNSSKIWLENAK